MTNFTVELDVEIEAIDDLDAEDQVFELLNTGSLHFAIKEVKEIG